MFTMRLLILALLFAVPVLARPTGPTLLCSTWPDSVSCKGRIPTCSTCHTEVSPPTWNAFGTAVLTELKGKPFSENLASALKSIETADSDGDGVSNVAEFYAGSNPGNSAERWCALTPAPAKNPVNAKALQRASALLCGKSPTAEEMEAFSALPENTRNDAFHALVTKCLKSVYWRDVVLARMADPLITPQLVFGRDSPAGVAFSDYAWDYRLFSWVMTEDRDIRDLLLAQYHVNRDPDGSLKKVEGLIAADIPSYRGGPNVGGQPLDPPRRAGMVTTAWFLSSNTFLSGLPRTSAAQAYRAYLGYDIASLEGLVPVASEPGDLDKRGVAAPACSQCHSTLDPLAYAFLDYNGFGRNMARYDPARPKRVLPDWDGRPSVMLGKQIDSIPGFAKLAVESLDFRRTVGGWLFQHLYDRQPTLSELPAFEGCWKRLPELNWSANALTHCLVDLPTFTASRSSL
jgi:hypothetical protein